MARREWLAEGAGTGIVLFVVVTAKDLAVRAVRCRRDRAAR